MKKSKNEKCIFEPQKDFFIQNLWKKLCSTQKVCSTKVSSEYQKNVQGKKLATGLNIWQLFDFVARLTGEVLWGFDCTDCKDYGTYSVYFFLELSQFSNTEQKDMR